MGRVGVIAQMPATFALRVEASVVSRNSELRTLSTPILSRDGGVCYSGRDSDDDVAVLILPEDAVEELASAIRQLTDEDVHDRARGALQRLKGSSFLSDLQRGLRVPRSGKNSYLTARSDGTDVRVGIIGRNIALTSISSQDMEKYGSLILLLSDAVSGEENDLQVEPPGTQSVDGP